MHPEVPSKSQGFHFSLCSCLNSRTFQGTASLRASVPREWLYREEEIRKLLFCAVGTAEWKRLASKAVLLIAWATCSSSQGDACRCAAQTCSTSRKWLLLPSVWAHGVPSALSGTGCCCSATKCSSTQQ